MIFTITFNDRLNHYLGNIMNETVIDSDKFYTIKHYQNIYSNNNGLMRNYINPFNQLLKNYDYTNKVFLLIIGDIQNTLNKYGFVKNRTIDDNKPIILKCLNFNRHWGHYYNKPKDLPYEKK